MATCSNQMCRRSLSSAEMEVGKGKCAVCLVKGYKWALAQAYRERDQVQQDMKDLITKNERLHAKLLGKV